MFPCFTLKKRGNTLKSFIHACIVSHRLLTKKMLSNANFDITIINKMYELHLYLGIND